MTKIIEKSQDAKWRDPSLLKSILGPRLAGAAVLSAVALGCFELPV